MDNYLVDDKHQYDGYNHHHGAKPSYDDDLNENKDKFDYNKKLGHNQKVHVDFKDIKVFSDVAGSIRISDWESARNQHDDKL